MLTSEGEDWAKILCSKNQEVECSPARLVHH
jgi:hypothetical protein